MSWSWAEISGTQLQLVPGCRKPRRSLDGTAVARHLQLQAPSRFTPHSASR